jgi:peptidylprolyl isomerase
MRTGTGRLRVGLASVGLAGVGLASLLAACSASSGSSPGSIASSSPAAAATVALVTGTQFGQKPTIQVPATHPPPKSLQVQVLASGDGPAIGSGQVAVAQFYGQTWDLRDGKANVFDDSYSRGRPTALALGVGRALKGLDEALIGKHTGSRVLVTIPADLGFGSTADAKKPLAGHALIFVVDLLDVLELDSSATGAPAGALPPGLPAIRSTSGTRPTITSVAGVHPVAKPLSGLLLRGSGPKIDPAKSLALQVIQTDVATGKKTKQTWGNRPDIVSASQVLSLIPALTGQNVGSRAVAVTPSRGTTPSQIVIVDVVAQY